MRCLMNPVSVGMFCGLSREPEEFTSETVLVIPVLRTCFEFFFFFFPPLFLPCSS